MAPVRVVGQLVSSCAVVLECPTHFRVATVAESAGENFS